MARLLSVTIVLLIAACGPESAQRQRLDASGSGGSSGSGGGGAGGSGAGGGGGAGATDGGGAGGTTIDAAAGGAGGGDDGGAGGGSGGAGGGSGGGAGGSGGTDAGASGGAGGMTDAGTDVPVESCGSGCARLSVPLVAVATGTLFAIQIPATDMTGATATFRVCLLAGTSGQIQMYSQEGATMYRGHYDTRSFDSLLTCPTFQDLLFYFDSTGYDVTRVEQLGIKIEATGAGPWANPTVLYVDSIVITRPDGGVPPGPYQFTASSSPFVVNNGATPVPGSAVGWVP